MSKFSKVICAIAGMLIMSCVIWYGYTLATVHEIETLENQISVNTKTIEQIKETKIQLHNAAEALRNEYINDAELANKLSQKWLEIDETEKKLAEETNNMTEKLEKLQGKYLGTFELTAYCYGNVTATGTTPTANRTIAVDPKVIPYGSRVRVEGYGTYIAEDCGGAVKGNIIDIYIPGYENCINFGRRKAKVYILE